MELMIRRRLARVTYDSVTDVFHGRFVTLTQDIVFEGATLPVLRADGERKLIHFLAACARRGEHPYRDAESRSA